MAHTKPGWKDVLQAAKSEGSRSNDRADKARAKKIASIHYKRRKLDKDVKKYIKRDRIKGSEIERIGRQHGFHLSSTPFREDIAPHDNA